MDEGTENAISVIGYTSGTIGVISLTSRGFTDLGYRPDTELTYEEWWRDGEMIRAVDRFKNFAMGDWLNAGERRFGETYAQALDEFQWGGIDKLKKLAWVARSVPVENRRRLLTWSHHHYVAALSFEEQRDWLDYAIEKELSANELRDLIKGARSSVQGNAEAVQDGAPDYPGVIELAGDGEGNYTEVVDREPETEPLGNPWNHVGTTDTERNVKWYADEDDEDEGESLPDNPNDAAAWLMENKGSSWCRRLTAALYAEMSKDYDDDAEEERSVTYEPVYD